MNHPVYVEAFIVHSCCVCLCICATVCHQIIAQDIDHWQANNLEDKDRLKTKKYTIWAVYDFSILIDIAFPFCTFYNLTNFGKKIHAGSHQIWETIFFHRAVILFSSRLFCSLLLRLSWEVEVDWFTKYFPIWKFQTWIWNIYGWMRLCRRVQLLTIP